MTIVASVFGTILLAALIAGAYALGIVRGTEAAREEYLEIELYMDHTHGGDPDDL
ncbi:MAG: hypothetical protein U0L91_03320 [Gemmiger sp.]|uniref:hypothetical protein n=1 Tax=Gemmiger sp. TaxID=2049027 RepID=UPI002E769EFB|nr:hypothetical protein [Gemmiger sp.]MEE0800292.1 hypothetical protein [Gemmiger sp.]